jgi:hypothetical protein
MEMVSIGPTASVQEMYQVDRIRWIAPIAAPIAPIGNATKNMTASKGWRKRWVAPYGIRRHHILF